SRRLSDGARTRSPPADRAAANHRAVVGGTRRHVEPAGERVGVHVEARRRPRNRCDDEPAHAGNYRHGARRRERRRRGATTGAGHRARGAARAGRCERGRGPRVLATRRDRRRACTREPALRCRASVLRQREYARQRGVPWGISECAYAFTDRAGNYQYRAFGVPGLGLKRGLSSDLVVAPYATALAALVDPAAAADNFRKLAKAGLEGGFGFY